MSHTFGPAVSKSLRPTLNPFLDKAMAKEIATVVLPTAVGVRLTHHRSPPLPLTTAILIGFPLHTIVHHLYNLTSFKEYEEKSGLRKQTKVRIRR